jgi:prevent-host-death family protein
MANNIEIGAYEAKTHLPRLLREVAAGQSFTITLRGKPVAELKPSSESGVENKNAKFVHAMREFRKRLDLPSLTAEQIKEMIEYGRR